MTDVKEKLDYFNNQIAVILDFVPSHRLHLDTGFCQYLISLNDIIEVSDDSEWRILFWVRRHFIDGHVVFMTRYAQLASLEAPDNAFDMKYFLNDCLFLNGGQIEGNKVFARKMLSSECPFIVFLDYDLYMKDQTISENKPSEAYVLY